ncbi:cytochrome C oxidase subunit III [Staphylococcus saprophyticus]|jgi:cytochrome aa3-600 menaquinol oxidase subunit 3|uniref:Probable quinol oxidase subunit 3 n=2 Tax=Staphylococcus saprophyticus TaxID=29385 RepID=QOX3_STAS1|nr:MULTISPECIES: cytochrome aa3 quinol oxidase subunit III [Staphylococcus]Q49WI2.1 RecName: Full=Probable quinol oxidase subunit 3; AltName: Full=Quinol oxidase polypeptide III [Staphylococcus saprophyticus subsp. saprophyticus ATCC 15305 = NCTC 7292]CRV23671.1 Quinol oxidase subunit 3 [Streptococcus equi subsp. equi]AMG20817.1 quinol oxidase subunit 3 [Staphylococcus saprophyticus]AMG33888.1 quinol oxidase subunit 3 [Staphylococcus saprophyticus]ASE59733.1 quinol oxidase subunit 3 [Staphyloc
MSHDANTIDQRSHEGNLNKLGFWVFLTAEFSLFGTLFATLLTLQHGGDYAGKMTTELFELPLVLIMTFALLISSYTCGIAIYYMRKEKEKLMLIWMIITVLLGMVFVGFEIYEFAHYVHEGVNLTIGSYWSSFFILLGTHGAHVSLGIVWIICLLIQVAMRGLNKDNAPKLFIVSLYWHFLDVVWIFIFTAVYMIGMVFSG